MALWGQQWQGKRHQSPDLASWGLGDAAGKTIFATAWRGGVGGCSEGGGADRASDDRVVQTHC